MRQTPDGSTFGRSANHEAPGHRRSLRVGRDGRVRLVRSLGLGLDEKAVEAIRKWRFDPGMKDGVPVNVSAQIEVNFRLPWLPRL